MGLWEKSLPVKSTPPSPTREASAAPERSTQESFWGFAHGAGRRPRRGVTSPRPALSQMDPGSALSFPLSPGPGFRLPFGESMEDGPAGWGTQSSGAALAPRPRTEGSMV